MGYIKYVSPDWYGENQEVDEEKGKRYREFVARGSSKKKPRPGKSRICKQVIKQINRRQKLAKMQKEKEKQNDNT